MESDTPGTNIGSRAVPTGNKCTATAPDDGCIVVENSRAVSYAGRVFAMGPYRLGGSLQNPVRCPPTDSGQCALRSFVFHVVLQNIYGQSNIATEAPSGSGQTLGLLFDESTTSEKMGDAVLKNIRLEAYKYNPSTVICKVSGSDSATPILSQTINGTNYYICPTLYGLAFSRAGINVLPSTGVSPSPVKVLAPIEIWHRPTRQGELVNINGMFRSADVAATSVSEVPNLVITCFSPTSGVPESFFSSDGASPYDSSRCNASP